MRDLPPYGLPLAVLALAALFDPGVAPLRRNPPARRRAGLADRRRRRGAAGAAAPGSAPPTAAVDLSICAFALIAVLDDLGLRRRLHLEAARQRDETRAMLAQAIADNFDGVVVLDDSRRIILASQLAQTFLDPAGATAQTAAALPAPLRAEVEAALAAEHSAGRAGQDRRDRCRRARRRRPLGRICRHHVVDRRRRPAARRLPDISRRHRAPRPRGAARLSRWPRSVDRGAEQPSLRRGARRTPRFRRPAAAAGGRRDQPQAVQFGQ